MISLSLNYLLKTLSPNVIILRVPGVKTVMHRAHISELREQVHHSIAKARREFISSTLGPKSHPAQWNPTRAPNKGVWRLIYRQFFVSVIGVAGVT